MIYREFEVLIQVLAQDGGWQLSYTGEVGDATQKIEPPVHREEAAALNQTVGYAVRCSAAEPIPQGLARTFRLQQPRDSPNSPQILGERLWNALFSGSLGRRFEVAFDRARQRGEGLRLKLCFDLSSDDAAWAAALPWELLRRSGEDFLALDNCLSIVRYLTASEPPSPDHFEPPLRVLALLSEPEGWPRLELGVEMANLREALGGEGVELVELRNPTRERLHKALAEQGPFHTVHFLGHGDFDERAGWGRIVLVSESGAGDPLSGRALARLLRRDRRPRLVVLNGCDTAHGDETNAGGSVASALVSAGIAAVVAMQFPISDRAAILFSRSLYRQLGRRASLDTAVAEGRQAVALGGSGQWATPAVFLRLRDGNLWASESSPREAPVEDLQDLDLGRAISGGDMEFVARDDQGCGGAAGQTRAKQHIKIREAVAVGTMTFTAQRRRAKDE